MNSPVSARRSDARRGRAGAERTQTAHADIHDSAQARGLKHIPVLFPYRDQALHDPAGQWANLNLTAFGAQRPALLFQDVPLRLEDTGLTPKPVILLGEAQILFRPDISVCPLMGGAVIHLFSVDMPTPTFSGQCCAIPCQAMDHQPPACASAHGSGQSAPHLAGSRPPVSVPKSASFGAVHAIKRAAPNRDRSTKTGQVQMPCPRDTVNRVVRPLQRTCLGSVTLPTCPSAARQHAQEGQRFCDVPFVIDTCADRIVGWRVLRARRTICVHPRYRASGGRWHQATGWQHW